MLLAFREFGSTSNQMPHLLSELLLFLHRGRYYRPALLIKWYLTEDSLQLLLNSSAGYSKHDSDNEDYEFYCGRCAKPKMEGVPPCTEQAAPGLAATREHVLPAAVPIALPFTIFVMEAYIQGGWRHLIIPYTIGILLLVTHLTPLLNVVRSVVEASCATSNPSNVCRVSHRTQCTMSRPPPRRIRAHTLGLSTPLRLFWNNRFLLIWYRYSSLSTFYAHETLLDVKDPPPLQSVRFFYLLVSYAHELSPWPPRHMIVRIARCWMAPHKVLNSQRAQRNLALKAHRDRLSRDMESLVDSVVELALSDEVHRDRQSHSIEGLADLVVALALTDEGPDISQQPSKLFSTRNEFQELRAPNIPTGFNPISISEANISIASLLGAPALSPQPLRPIPLVPPPPNPCKLESRFVKRDQELLAEIERQVLAAENSLVIPETFYQGNADDVALIRLALAGAARAVASASKSLKGVKKESQWRAEVLAKVKALDMRIVFIGATLPPPPAETAPLLYDAVRLLIILVATNQASNVT
ncbi:hypothetical protein B0H10DRAFT_1941949 [Mycena sp. CBHHK59/15]|nr:hypothetical protein B0H10DRAFT_1941949 [Mycena sp. CBHHK59/15]